MICFACPECCTTFEVSDAKIGTKLNCEVCGKRIQVPAPPAAVPSGVPAVKGASRRRAGRLPASARTRAAGARWPAAGPFVLVAVGVGVLLAAGGVALLSASRGRPPQASAGGQEAAPASTGSQASSQSADSAPKALAVLKTHCYRCHGDGGTAEGGLNFILDRERLVERKKIVPGDARASKLYRRVAEGEMPPADETPRPDGAAVADLRRWIDDGAPPLVGVTPAGDFISQVKLVASIHDDLFSLPERDRKFIRYFTATNLANAHLSADEMRTWRYALAKLVNSLSWNKEVVPPHEVGSGGAIFRVDVRDYSWSDRLWQDVLSTYPFGVLDDSPGGRDLMDAAGGSLSFVRADWFIATASRPPLYHQLLQLPETERRLEEQLHLDVAEDVRQERVARAGFNGSGVSRNNRLIERHESPYGSYWRSYDFADGEGPHNLFAFPLGPGDGTNTPRASGGEIIFNLPNGLHAFMLIDEKGRRLDKGALSIVSDPRRPDRAVENGVSCMNCHARGLIVKADQVREHVARNPNAFSREEADSVRALYPPEGTLNQLFAQDNVRFARAVEKTGGRLTTTEPIASLVGQYERDLDLTAAAAELGLSQEELVSQLDRSATLARVLGPLKVAGGSVQRSVFTAEFPVMVQELARGTYLPPEKVGR